MRNVVRSFFFVALLVLSGSVRMAQAQDGAQTKAPRTPVKAVLDNWNDVGAG